MPFNSTVPYNGDTFNYVFYLSSVSACIHCNSTAYRPRYTRSPFKAHQSGFNACFSNRRQRSACISGERVTVNIVAQQLAGRTNEQSINTGVGYEQIAAIAYQIESASRAFGKLDRIAKLFRSSRLGIYPRS